MESQIDNQMKAATVKLDEHKAEKQKSLVTPKLI